MSNLMKTLTIGSGTYEICDAAAREALESKANYTETNTAVKNAAHRNLLYNSDFRNPVIQAAFGRYYGSRRYIIDGWYDRYGFGVFETTNHGITIAYGENHGYLNQMITDANLLVGKTLTFAVKLYDGSVHIAKGVYSSESITSIKQINENCEITIAPGFVQIVVTEGSLGLQWAALYEGDYSLDTLPEYQPKGYEIELLVCKQYEPTTGEYIGLRKFGQPVNLLDNSDFSNPIMQAGFNGFHGVDKYVIDRWISWNLDAVQANGGITPQSPIDQNISPVIIDVSRSYTVAIGFVGGGVLSYYGKLGDGIGLYATVYAGLRGSGAPFVRVGTGQNVEWVALYEGEYTADTLPEYRPKGYGAELLECMRYYQQSFDGNNPKTSVNLQINFGANPNWLQSTMFQIPMQATPTVIVYDYNTGNPNSMSIWSTDYLVSDVTVGCIGTKGFCVLKSSGIDTNVSYGFHYSASADL